MDIRDLLEIPMASTPISQTYASALKNNAPTKTVILNNDFTDIDVKNDSINNESLDKAIFYSRLPRTEGPRITISQDKISKAKVFLSSKIQRSIKGATDEISENAYSDRLAILTERASSTIQICGIPQVIWEKVETKLINTGVISNMDAPTTRKEKLPKLYMET